jgi:hypothetical protein
MLIDEPQTKFEFLISALAVDFGVHVDQMSARECCVVIIENLLSDSVNVNRDDVDQVNLIGLLKASTVAKAGQIEVSLCFEDGFTRLLMMSWLTCQIAATSTQIHSHRLFVPYLYLSKVCLSML